MIIEKVERSFVGWKKLYLSKGGGGERITVIKSTLSSLPMYLTSFFSMPIHISHRLDNLQKDFLEGMRDAKKYH